MFSDSSKDVAAAALYLRSHTDNDCHVSLIAARISVLSSYEVAHGSIPRKKLVGLDIDSRLLKECLESTSLPLSAMRCGRIRRLS